VISSVARFTSTGTMTATAKKVRIARGVVVRLRTCESPAAAQRPQGTPGLTDLRLGYIDSMPSEPVEATTTPTRLGFVGVLPFGGDNAIRLQAGKDQVDGAGGNTGSLGNLEP